MSAAAVKRTVLVADDNEHVREILKTALARVYPDGDTGIDVIEARDGEEALAALEQRPLDLAILDVWMPSLDGLKLLGRLREGARTAKVPVLVVSASSERGEVLAAGADEYLPKPLRLVDVLDVVRRLLRVR